MINAVQTSKLRPVQPRTWAIDWQSTCEVPSGERLLSENKNPSSTSGDKRLPPYETLHILRLDLTRKHWEKTQYVTMVEKQLQLS